MSKKKSIVTSLFFNLVLVILEIVGLVLSVQRHGINVFIFYTENSNYFALLVSLIFCVGAIIAIKKKSELPNWINILRFVATVCLSITFIVSFFVIIPFKPSMWRYMLYKGSSLYQHLLCPILSIISFLFFEYKRELSKSAIFYALIPTLIYGIICVILNLTKVIVGPYPFFYFYQIPWYLSTLSIFGVVFISLTVAYIIFSFPRIREKHERKKLNKKQKNV